MKSANIPAGLVTILLMLTLWTPSVLSETTRFTVSGGDGGSLVTFTSRAPRETIEGRTGAVSGFIAAELADLSLPLSVVIEIDLREFETGNRLRNQHMRDNHLETDDFPLATFRADSIIDPPAGGLRLAETIHCDVAGQLDLHGVRRGVTLPLELSLNEVDHHLTLRVRSEFEILLADHRIKRPGFLMLKLSESQQVQVDIVATSDSERGR